jgi:hypothetical protein
MTVVYVVAAWLIVSLPLACILGRVMARGTGGSRSGV